MINLAAVGGLSGGKSQWKRKYVNALLNCAVFNIAS